MIENTSATISGTHLTCKFVDNFVNLTYSEDERRSLIILVLGSLQQKENSTIVIQLTIKLKTKYVLLYPMKPTFSHKNIRMVNYGAVCKENNFK